MGIIAAPHNGFGVNGIAPNIRHLLASLCRPQITPGAAGIAIFSNEDIGGRFQSVMVAHTMLDAASSLRPGDVLLIEQHAPGPASGDLCARNCHQFEFVPMEYYQEFSERHPADHGTRDHRRGSGGQWRR